MSEENLGAFNGAGGVMRDAERRATNPAQVPPKKPEIPDFAAGSRKAKGAAKPEEFGVIKSIRVYGAEAFAQKEQIAEELTKRLVGETPRTKQEVADALTFVRTNLVSKGYYLFRDSRSLKYNKKDGSLGVRVDDGHFGKLNVRFYGDAAEELKDDGRWYSREQLLRRFRRIRENDTFDYFVLRDVLLDVNSHPDLLVDTHIAKRTEDRREGKDRYSLQYADLDLRVRESFPLHAILEVNNYGMEEIEEWQTSLTLQYLNLTKRDDVLTLSPSISFNGELMSLAGSYLLPHAWWLGGNTTLYGGWSYLDTEDVVPRLDLEGIGWFLGLQHSEYLIDTRRHLLSASVGILWRYIEDQYSAYGRKLNQRDVSVMPLSLALSYTQRAPDALRGRNFANLQGVFCAVTTGDDLDEMWTDADDPYSILRFQVARLQPVFGDSKNHLHQWTVYAKLEGQYSPDVLIPTEKLSIGGFNTVRGYHSRGYLGDTGVYGTLELRTPVLVDAVSSRFSSRSGKTPLDRIQALVFTDYGYTFYNDLPSGYDEDEWLWSIGVGLRAAMTKYCQARLDFGVPLHDISGGDDDDFELYLSVQFQY